MASDSDDEFDDILEAAKRACDLADEPAGDLPSDSNDDDDDNDNEDLNLINDLQKRYSMIPDGMDDDGDEELNSREPLSSMLSRSPDDPEDDFETLLAIQRRFASYSTDDDDFLGTLSSPDLDNASSSPFPKAAEAFVDAIKKNRECQRLIRAKLLHINSRIEQNKELRKRVGILKGFQTACHRRTGKALSNKSEIRAQLISLPKKSNAKVMMQYGPAENPHVSIFREVVEKSAPLARAKWSKQEDQRLADGVKREFQDMIFQKSVGLLNDSDGQSFANFDDIVASIGEVDVTPERMRQLLPKLDWDNLASVSVPGRSGDECQARWLSSEDPLINHAPWTSEEDKMIIHCVQNGLKNWFDIAVSLGSNRTPFQCLSRYQRSLNASILKREWTSEEDDQLRAAVEAFGESNWQVVAAAMEGRMGPQCSNRWLKVLHPTRKRTGRWTDEEDKRLKVSVTFFGAKNWKKIAEFVSGRTQVQCRERWVNSLDPSLNRSAWTEEEDEKLRQAIEMHGYCWSKVAACVPPRTDSQCRRRWTVILPNQVPLLRAAREMQKVSLISNFVDRESERPALGPSDFVPSQEIICLLDQSESANPPKKRKRANPTSGEAPNGTKKKRAKKNSEKTKSTGESLNVAG